MLLVINIPSYGSAWESLDWRALRSKVPSLPEEKPKWGVQGFIADHEALVAFAEADLEVHISKDETARQLGHMMVKLSKKLERTEAQRYADGESVVIHIPDYTLAKITRVEVITDACTELLQTMLDEGWKLLAVCPPNAQRRPDYVLGK